MLTKLDETLRHQLPTTFDHAWTSDHRFYDRYWFGIYDPDGRMHAVIGMGLYVNTNVMDGFVAVQQPAGKGKIEQHNLRVSRALRQNVDETKVGPLSVQIIEPYKEARLLCRGDESPISCDLIWKAFLPPAEEKHHYNRIDGRVFQDYHRYTQTGDVHGKIELNGNVVQVDNWWGGRDHSWGVRSQVGGYEPVTSAQGIEALSAFGYIFDWSTFHTDKLGGYIQVQCLGDGTKLFVDGEIGWPATGRIVQVVDADIHAELHEGTRIYRHLKTHLKCNDGSELIMHCDPILGYWSMDGTGYDWGWDDGKGLGFHRGDYQSENDTYDITHPEDVIRPDGTRHTPSHREAPVRVRIDGDGDSQQGVGHQVFVIAGSSSWLGVG